MIPSSSDSDKRASILLHEALVQPKIQEFEVQLDQSLKNLFSSQSKLFQLSFKIDNSTKKMVVDLWDSNSATWQTKERIQEIVLQRIQQERSSSNCLTLVFPETGTKIAFLNTRVRVSLEKGILSINRVPIVLKTNPRRFLTNQMLSSWIIGCAQLKDGWVIFFDPQDLLGPTFSAVHPGRSITIFSLNFIEEHRELAKTYTHAIELGTHFWRGDKLKNELSKIYKKRISERLKGQEPSNLEVSQK